MFMGLLHHFMLRLNSGQGNSNSVEDEATSGGLLGATDEEMCKKVWDLVYSDRCISVIYI